MSVTIKPVNADALEILGQVDAVRTNDHFVYASTRHGSTYVNKDALYVHTKETSLLCWRFAEHFKGRNIQVVVGPEKGGIILAQWTAHWLTVLNGYEVLAVYAEKDSDQFIIKRGYEQLIPGKNILLVEDVLTTGGSIKKVFETGPHTWRQCPWTRRHLQPRRGHRGRHRPSPRALFAHQRQPRKLGGGRLPALRCGCSGEHIPWQRQGIPRPQTAVVSSSQHPQNQPTVPGCAICVPGCFLFIKT